MRTPIPEELEQIAKDVVDAAVKLHIALSPGLLESVYTHRKITHKDTKTQRKMGLRRRKGVRNVSGTYCSDFGLKTAPDNFYIRSNVASIQIDLVGVLLLASHPGAMSKLTSNRRCR